MSAGFEDVPMFDVASDERLVSLDRKVDAAEGDGILARWEFGRALLAERGAGKQLPNGRLDAVAAIIGKDRSEVKYRMLFAGRYQTRDEVVHAMHHFTSWFSIRNELGNVHVANNSGQNEWYTPPALIEAARAAMGGIDLDPASSAVAQQTVQAVEFHTADDDGLAHEWVGNIWLNPPYAQPLIGQFIDHLIAEYTAGRIRSAVVLVNNATDTAWGQKLLAVSVRVCFLSGRVRFLDPDGNPSGAPLQGQMAVWLHADGKRDPFDGEFARFGAVL
jgi:DNA N-6-adenine-methyltransferase (Dam)